MKNWEYRQEVVDYDEDIVEAANKQGQDGWELVSVISAFHGLDHQLIFKREVTKPSDTEKAIAVGEEYDESEALRDRRSLANANFDYGFM